MRCSWCESRLDEYVDATLAPQPMRAIYAHLHECAACETLHRRLRIVDGLLHTAGSADLAPEFTRGVMAQIRNMPVPRFARHSLWILAAFYLICAWMMTGAVFILMRPGTRAAAGSFAAFLRATVQAVVHGAHALAPIAPIAISVVVSVLSIDALLLALLVFFYRVVRPRLIAHLTSEALS